MSNLLTVFPTATGHLEPAVWTDRAGVTHKAVGADVHPGIRLLWTACERQDIPADAAWIQRDEDKVTCDGCREAQQ